MFFVEYDRRELLALQGLMDWNNEKLCAVYYELFCEKFFYISNQATYPLRRNYEIQIVIQASPLHPSPYPFGKLRAGSLPLRVERT